MIAELDDYSRQMESVKEEAATVVSGLTLEQFNWSPEPGRWSVAECLDHLNATDSLYLPAIRESIRAARERQMLSGGPFRYGLLESWFLRKAEPPPKFKTKAPKEFRPAANLDPVEVLERFLHIHDQVEQEIRQAQEIDLKRTKVPAPFARWIRLSLGITFALMAAHDRRHLWQARQVLAAMSANQPR